MCRVQALRRSLTSENCQSLSRLVSRTSWLSSRAPSRRALSLDALVRVIRVTASGLHDLLGMCEVIAGHLYLADLPG